MWLLLQGRRGCAALDLDKGRIWSMADDPILTIDLPDGRLSISFASPEAAASAAEHLLQAIRESKDVIDTADKEWGEYQAEWQYFDPQREEQEADASSQEPKNEPPSDAWEPAPPSDPRLRRLWEKAALIHGQLRPKQEKVEQVILDVCRGRFLSAQEIGIVLDRSPGAVRAKFLIPLVNAGRLEKEFPDHLKHPRQRYRTASHRSATR